MLPELHRVSIMAAVLFIALVIFTWKLYQHFTHKIEAQKRKNMHALLEAQENERRNIAKEVHDNLCPLLSITNMQVEAAVKKTTDTGALILLDDIQKQLKHAIFICRDISHELTPFISLQNGLKESISDYTDKIKTARGLNIEFSYSFQQEIHHQKSASVCRIVLELMNNTIKHANASYININISEQDGMFRLQYSDNGIGIAENKITHGLGLKNIESRVRLLNGHLYAGNMKQKRGYDITIEIPKEEMI